MSPTLFYRQFLITSNPISTLSHWQHKVVHSWQIYAHPSLPLRVVERPEVSIVLMGFIINPHQIHESDNEIITALASATQSVDDIPMQLHPLAGRFVLFIRIAHEFYVFHDPCGLRSVYYSQHGEEISLGSQPNIIAHATSLVKSDTYEALNHSDYKRNILEYWLPCNSSVYKDVHQLIPNHYLRMSDKTMIRYWPRKLINKKYSIEEGVDKMSELLVNLLKAAYRRYPLALPITAGWDSRLLLACSQEIAHDLYFYTLKYRALDKYSPDILIPAHLLNRLGYSHHLIDCTKPMSTSFRDDYLRNVSLAHEDWGTIAYGMTLGYPSDHVCLKGNCAEIGRCFYYREGQHEPITRAEQLVDLVEEHEKGWIALPFIQNSLTSWTEDAVRVAHETDVDILDLFYWEHKMGSWQAQSQLEWDTAQEAFSPFNHRGLLEIMLSVAPQYRCGERNILYEKIIEKLWPTLLEEPINPRQKKTIPYYFRRAIKRLSKVIA